MPTYLVLGLGVSGLAAADLLLDLGSCVLGIDDKVKRGDPRIADLEKKGLRIVEGEISWEEIDELIVSPGVAPTHPVYSSAMRLEVPIIGELELALRFLKQPAVAITGTNGKTTVTLLIAHILRHSRRAARAIGNVGDPLSSYVLGADSQEILVVELSSYQLETMNTPFFEMGVILNITPDHLDRYPGMKEYAQAKIGLQRCMKEGGKLVVSDQVFSEYGDLFAQPVSRFAECGEIVESFLPKKYRDRGVHERENALAAWVVCKHFAVSAEDFYQGLETFKIPPHRIEFVMEIGGVSFYDDSKGTNLDAVIQAVRAMKGPVILIVGGVDKGASYLPWKEAFAGKVKKMIAIGQAKDKIYRELGCVFDVLPVDSLPTAVKIAKQSADFGDCVLLSPGCASFDMFRDYAHRGEVFQQCIYEEGNIR